MASVTLTDVRKVYHGGVEAVRGVSFEVEDGDTRFLGDLYQDLSERARKKYALLQTPIFVEEFILDRTLDPAIDEFGLDEVRMIDPTCGSGHFLLGGFARLFGLWIKREDNEVVAAQRALDGVWGCDINPFAVAIARFRLIVAALRACGTNRLKDAPAWNIHLATGDSLLFGSRWDREGNKKGEQQFLRTEEESWAPKLYACEDKEAISEVLGQQYHAVVGNPPYIIVRDRCLNQAYRDRYSSCHQKYTLAVPFAERFFDLAISSEAAGFVGQITSNSFMKREFGKKLVESFFSRQDLTHVVDTSGAYIPGHGTPTVIILGRNRPPQDNAVRAVLGIRGEPATPDDPSKGLVWLSILNHIDNKRAEDDYTSSSDVPRSAFSIHPWSIGGGGAAELKTLIEQISDVVLINIADTIGITSFPMEDDAFILPQESAHRKGISTQHLREMVVGDAIRDWELSPCDPSVFPYSNDFKPLEEDLSLPLFRHLWRSKTVLSNSKMFGGKTKVESGLKWFEYGRLTASKLKTPLSIICAGQATHNHFFLDRGGKVFKNTVQVIKMPSDFPASTHLGLLGVLNSSIACFWLKQVSHNKGDSTDQHGARTIGDPAFNTYHFNGTKIGQFPIPSDLPESLASRIDDLANMKAQAIGEFNRCKLASNQAVEDAGLEFTQRLQQMIALQEELDWQCYYLFGILNEDLCYHDNQLPKLRFGERAFEFILARHMASNELETTWFERHGSKPITELPVDWPDDYRKLVERRIEVIESNKEIALIEKPEYKRRWNTESWKEQQQRALKNWLLDRLESQHYWPDTVQHEPRLQSVAELSDKASGDHEFLQVAAIYRGREDFDVSALVAELVESESVPFLPALRYKPAGRRKREVWEKTWELQRKDETGEDVGDIKVPPKYTSADFQSTGYWRLRGKLDVPKERWISFPHCETESDPSLVVGWAGWNHLQQATALIAYYDARKREGWDAKRLTPLLAGLDQLLPWIHQWHPEVDPEFGETAGQSFETMLKADAHELGLTLEDIRAWEPPAKKKGGRRKAKG